MNWTFSWLSQTRLLAIDRLPIWCPASFPARVGCTSNLPRLIFSAWFDPGSIAAMMRRTIGPPVMASRKCQAIAQNGSTRRRKLPTQVGSPSLKWLTNKANYRRRSACASLASAASPELGQGALAHRGSSRAGVPILVVISFRPPVLHRLSEPARRLPCYDRFPVV